AAVADGIVRLDHRGRREARSGGAVALRVADHDLLVGIGAGADVDRRAVRVTRVRGARDVHARVLRLLAHEREEVLVDAVLLRDRTAGAGADDLLRSAVGVGLIDDRLRAVLRRVGELVRADAGADDREVVVRGALDA